MPGGRVRGYGGPAGLVPRRARTHRLLLAAALGTVLLTTAVLTALTAYTGAFGDAALRHALAAADTSLVVKADVSHEGRAKADAEVREGARRTFGGLPVTVRTLARSGPYALPAPAGKGSPGDGAGSDDPDLTYFAALDPGQVRITEGRAPREGGDRVEAALPAGVAERLRLGPGDRLTLTDRLGGPRTSVEITGLYRPADADAPYWRLDDLAGRGVRTGGFTTYGPLLAAPGALGEGRVSTGSSGWLATADFSTVTAGRTDALREAAGEGTAWLRGRPALSSTTAVGTALPDVLDRLDRSLLVARSTLLVVALQLVLLAGCALLLVARLLSDERADETRLLRARGASRGQLAVLAGLEASLLAVPALLCAPLLAGPLTRLVARLGAADGTGPALGVSGWGGGAVWAAAGATALGCALAVTLPALTAPAAAGGRARPLPAPVRAGADVALLAVAGVVCWRLSRQPAGALAEGAGSPGGLGVDPLLVAAPALALLAGTVLTLRLLPPLARLAERRATGGRGLTAALAAWRLSRRPMRGAGPVLLLVLAVALGVLAVGQGASWERSQDDQADFRAGAPVRVLAAGSVGPGRTEEYAAVPGVREVAPAARAQLPLSGDRTATVLALDTARAAGTLTLRPDLSDVPVRALLAPLGPQGAVAGAPVPEGGTRLELTARLDAGGASPGTPADVTVTVRDGYGVVFRLPAGELSADGRPHTLSAALSPGPLTVTGVELSLAQPYGRAERHRFTLEALSATAADGTAQRLALPGSWTVSAHGDSRSGPEAGTAPAEPRLLSAAPPSLAYGTGYVPADLTWISAVTTVRLDVAQPDRREIAAVATDRFLDSAGARTGALVDVALDGHSVPVRIVDSVRALPTTDAGTDPDRDGGALLIDLRSANHVLQARHGQGLTPTEWWLRTAPGGAAEVAAGLRAAPDADPARVVVRDEVARELRDDPFGAGPRAASTAASGVAAALAAVGFAVSAAGARRERAAEFAVLRALGAPRRDPARAVAVEQCVLVVLGLLAGTVLGAVLARVVIPLVVLTPQAAHPVPDVLVALPAARVALLLAAVALVPLLVTVLPARPADPAAALGARGGGPR